MGTVASELKSEREKRKISLSQIAAETRISLRHLESLEEGRFADLPGGIYNRAFLKAYCEILNLDPHEIMQRYDAENSPAADRVPKSKTHTPQKTSSLRISPFIIWGIILLFSAGGIFFGRKWIYPYFTHSAPAAVQYEPMQPPVNATANPAASSNSTPVAQANAMPESKAPEPADQQPAADQAIAAPAQPLPVTASDANALRLEIRATETCWISINRDGNPVLKKTMQPGEIQSFNAVEKFLLVVGNAGGIQLTINGKPAKPLGKPGEVVKVQIDESNLQNFLIQTAG